MNQVNEGFVTIDQAVDDHVAGTAPKAENAAPDSEAPADNEAPAEEAKSPEAAPEQPEPASETEPVGEPEPVPEGAEFDWDNLMVPVEIDGETREVNARELKDGWLRQSDYTRKTQQVAEQRKAVEAEAAQITEQRGRYLQGLEQMAAALANQAPPDPDPDMEHYDPSGYLLAKEAQREYREKQQGLYQHYQEEMALQQQAIATQRAEFLENNKKQLLQARPDLADDKKLTEYGNVNRQFLMDRGFSQQEANSVLDWRQAEIVDMARRFAEAQGTAQKKQAEVSKGKRPYIRQSQTSSSTATSSVTRKAEAADKRLTKEGTVDAAVEAILAAKEAAQAQQG